MLLSTTNCCRLCARMKTQPLMHSLESLKSTDETIQLLDFCLHQQADSKRNDSLPFMPTAVCDTCVDVVKFLAKFVHNCQTAQQKLQQLISSELCDSTAFDVQHDSSNHYNDNVPSIETVIVDDKLLDIAVIEQDDHVEMKVETDYCPGILPKTDNGRQPGRRKTQKNDDTKVENTYREKETTISTSFLDAETRSSGASKSRRNNVAPHSTSDVDEAAQKQSKRTADQPPSRCKKICQICGKVLSNSATFRVHMKMHLQDKNLVCNICHRRFYVKQELKVHMESIHEQKVFACSICDLKCRWRKSLNRHMQLHEENPYKHKCNHCEQAFARPHQLRIHVMKHTGDRVYCEECGTGYRHNYMLTQHKIRKHGHVIEGVQLYKISRKKIKDTQNEANAS
ncbi:myoneurin-like [Anopheles bellator]|uniref:myoneurin-like n=1 Tax=Anopheles bellator TaxID=139047 RepID=UPI002648DCBF|nr:myoneurin-like [Anopheles bellator]